MSETNKSEKDGYLLIVLIVAVCAFSLGVVFGKYVGEDSMRRHAVQEKHATWTADDIGQPVFTWLPIKEAKQENKPAQ